MTGCKIENEIMDANIHSSKIYVITKITLPTLMYVSVYVCVRFEAKENETF